MSKVRDLELKADLEKNQSKMMLLVLDRPLHFLDLIDDTREFLDALLYQRKIPLEETPTHPDKNNVMNINSVLLVFL